MVLAFRWVGEDLVAHEDFIGLYLSDSITLVAITEDTILHMNIN